MKQDRSLEVEAKVVGNELVNLPQTLAATFGQSSSVALADTTERLDIEDVDGVVSYLALENYILRMPRSSLFGICAFGVVIKDADLLFRGLTDYEYRYMITDIAEVISECLKPHYFIAAHASGGEFACVRDAGRHFDEEQFARQLSHKVREMDLYCSNGRPMLVDFAVSAPIQLDMKSPSRAVEAIVRSLSHAEMAAKAIGNSLPDSDGGLKSLFQFGYSA